MYSLFNFCWRISHGLFTPLINYKMRENYHVIHTSDGTARQRTAIE